MIQSRKRNCCKILHMELLINCKRERYSTTQQSQRRTITNRLMINLTMFFFKQKIIIIRETLNNLFTRLSFLKYQQRAQEKKSHWTGKLHTLQH